MIDRATLKKHYWLKKELIVYCKKHDLSTSGSKNDLIQRIETYLVSGDKMKPPSSKPAGQRDSHQPLTLETLVLNYKNDAATRVFFEKHIGKHFRFDAYLRQFTHQENIPKNLTYGDLIQGWLAAEARRNQPGHQSHIDSQFEYNRFIRDFFAAEKNKSLSSAIKAWKKTKTLSGQRTYQAYLSSLLNK